MSSTTRTSEAMQMKRTHSALTTNILRKKPQGRKDMLRVIVAIIRGYRGMYGDCVDDDSLFRYDVAALLADD